MGAAEIEVGRAGPDACRLRVGGSLNGVAWEALSAAAAEARAGGARVLLLDLGRATLADGSGLTLLAKLAAEASRHEQRLLSWGLGPRCRRIVRAVGLGEVLAPCASEGEAREAAGLPPTTETPTPGVEGCAEEEWADGLGLTRVSGIPAGFRRLNVEGRSVRGPMDGFGQLWHKVYRLPLAGTGVSPGDAFRALRDGLGELWPPGNRVAFPPPGVVPGGVGLMELRLPGGAPLATGARVLHAGPTSFTFVTLSGHMEAGWITFAGRADEEGARAEVASFARTSDPLYEAGFVLFGHGAQERFWTETLTALARRLDVPARVEVHKACVDGSRNWMGAENLAFNAAARTGVAAVGGLLGAAVRRLRG